MRDHDKARDPVLTGPHGRRDAPAWPDGPLAAQFAQALLEHAWGGIGLVDGTGTVLYSAPGMSRILGFPVTELIGRNGFDLVHPDDRPRAEGLFAQLLRQPGGSVTTELRSRHRDGGWVCVEVTGTNRLHDPGVRGVVVNYHDITARKALETDARQAHQREAIDRLAGGVAHELNNLLTVIAGHGELLLARVPPGDPAVGHMHEIRQAADRAAGLARRLVAYSRKLLLAPRPVEVSALVAGLEPALRELAGPDIQVCLTPAADVPAVEVDPAHVELALLDLAANARDAMPDGGRLTVETATVLISEGQEIPPGEYVRVAVSDTGRGMDDAARARLFEPFVTLSGTGPGLGLAAVHGFVTQSGGHVAVDSAPGRGTTVGLYFPARPTPPRLATILLAESDALVRALAERVLTEHGYAVVPAADAAAARARCADHPDPIDLLILDSAALRPADPAHACGLLQAQPAAKVLYTSGAPGAADLELLQAAGVRLLFLEKPYSPEALVRAVQAALGAE